MGEIIPDRPFAGFVLTNTRQIRINYYYYSILLLHRTITEDVLLRTHIHYMFRARSHRPQLKYNLNKHNMTIISNWD